MASTPLIIRRFARSQAKPTAAAAAAAVAANAQPAQPANPISSAANQLFCALLCVPLSYH